MLPYVLILTVADIRLCIGALAQGASLLQTTFQPILLSGALISFIGKGKKLKSEYQACLARMGLSTDGTVEVLSKRLDEGIRQIRDEMASTSRHEHRRREFGQLPRVVSVMKEVQRQMALPHSWILELARMCQAPASIGEGMPFR